MKFYKNIYVFPKLCRIFIKIQSDQVLTKKHFGVTKKFKILLTFLKIVGIA